MDSSGTQTERGKTAAAYTNSMKLLFIVGICLVSAAVFAILGGVLGWLLFDFQLHNINHFQDPAVVNGLKLYQLFSAIGLFVVPPFLYTLVVTQKELSTSSNFSLLGLTQKPNATIILQLILFMGVSYPILAYLVEWNTNISLPESWKAIELWMRKSEEQAMVVTKLFLKSNGYIELLYTLVVIAVVPAIGEELLFRGVLQKLTITITKSNHWGVWITGILFSLLHFQFFGFVPRMLLGVVLGYLFLWSKSLWLPILVHFINNGSVVIAAYFYPNIIDETTVVFAENDTYNTLIILASLVLSLGTLYVIHNTLTKRGSKALPQ